MELTTTEARAQQIRESAPVAESSRERDAYVKSLATHFEDKHFSHPTPGQELMIKTLVEKDGTPRPPGFAIQFAPSNMYTNFDQGDLLFDQGASMFTSEVKATDGPPAYVLVDKNGVFLLKPGKDESQSDLNPQEFTKVLRATMDLVGNQSTNFLINGEPRTWPSKDPRFVIEDVPPDKAAEYVQRAASESLKSPFISTEDAKPPVQVDISKIEF